MSISYLREFYLEQLKSDIPSYAAYYQQPEPWLSSCFGSDGWSLPANIQMADIDLIAPTGTTAHFDLENTKKIYTALKGLSIAQATDERLWAYLTHVTFWKYMRLRWPIESYIDKPNLSAIIRERYFFMPNRDRALMRNGIARLWWYGYVSYDENREDPFELTRVLLSKLDIAQSLLERSFSRNRFITKTILSVLAEMERKNKPFPDRESFRKLMKHINNLGGVTILDALDEEDIEQIVMDRMKKIS